MGRKIIYRYNYIYIHKNEYYDVITLINYTSIMCTFTHICFYELIEKVCSYVNLKDILSLRGTCKDLCSLTTEIMARHIGQSIDENSKNLVRMYSIADYFEGKYDPEFRFFIEYMKSNVLDIVYIPPPKICKEIAGRFKALISSKCREGNFERWFFSNFDSEVRIALGKYIGNSEDLQTCYEIVRYFFSNNLKGQPASRDNGCDFVEHLIARYAKTWKTFSSTKECIYLIHILNNETCCSSLFLKIFFRRIYNNPDNTICIRFLNNLTNVYITNSPTDTKRFINDDRYGKVRQYMLIVDKILLIFLNELMNLYRTTYPAMNIFECLNLTKANKYVRATWFKITIRSIIDNKMNNGLVGGVYEREPLGIFLAYFIKQEDHKTMEKALDYIIYTYSRIPGHEWNIICIVNTVFTYIALDMQKVYMNRLIYSVTSKDGPGPSFLNTWINRLASSTRSQRYTLFSVIYDILIKDRMIKGSGDRSILSNFMMRLSSRINPKDAYSIGYDPPSLFLIERIIIQSQSIKVLTNLLEGINNSPNSKVQKLYMNDVEYKLAYLCEKRYVRK